MYTLLANGRSSTSRSSPSPGANSYSAFPFSLIFNVHLLQDALRFLLCSLGPLVPLYFCIHNPLTSCPLLPRDQARKGWSFCWPTAHMTTCVVDKYVHLSVHRPNRHGRSVGEAGSASSQSGPHAEIFYTTHPPERAALTGYPFKSLSACRQGKPLSCRVKSTSPPPPPQNSNMLLSAIMVLLLGYKASISDAPAPS